MRRRSETMTPADSADSHAGWHRVVLAIGLVLHVAIGGLVAVSGLIMPIWAVIVLVGVWIVALVAAIRWRHRPVAVLLVPVVMLAIWFLTAWLGESILGWSA